MRFSRLILIFYPRILLCFPVFPVYHFHNSRCIFSGISKYGRSCHKHISARIQYHFRIGGSDSAIHLQLYLTSARRYHFRRTPNTSR